MKTTIAVIASLFIFISSVIISLLIIDLALSIWELNGLTQFILFILSIITAGIAVMLSDVIHEHIMAGLGIVLMSAGVIVLSGLVCLRLLNLL
jgi:hypothetical protein